MRGPSTQNGSCPALAVLGGLDMSIHFPDQGMTDDGLWSSTEKNAVDNSASPCIVHVNSCFVAGCVDQPNWTSHPAASTVAVR